MKHISQLTINETDQIEKKRKEKKKTFQSKQRLERGGGK